MPDTKTEGVPLQDNLEYWKNEARYWKRIAHENLEEARRLNELIGKIRRVTNEA